MDGRGLRVEHSKEGKFVQVMTIWDGKLFGATNLKKFMFFWSIKARKACRAPFDTFAMMGRSLSKAKRFCHDLIKNTHISCRGTFLEEEQGIFEADCLYKQGEAPRSKPQ